jgi:hypothetical protein
MGQDILIRVLYQDKLFPKEYFEDESGYNKHGLSRTFYHFMSRPGTSTGEPELDQIGRITSVDIAPLYDMDEYGSERGEQLHFYLALAKRGQQILAGSKLKWDDVGNNIELVLDTLNALIEKLSTIDNLPQLLNDYGWDSIGYLEYFTDFNIDKGDGYSGNNFGQDLRNFKSFVEYAKDRGATTVYFTYSG